MTLTLKKLFFWFLDWHDGGNGGVPPNLDKVMNEGIAFIIDRFK